MKSKALILKPPLGGPATAGEFGLRRSPRGVAAAVALGVLLILAFASASPAQDPIAPPGDTAAAVQEHLSPGDAASQEAGLAAQPVQKGSILPAELPDLTDSLGEFVVRNVLPR